MQIRILGNKLFQLYIRLALAQFEEHRNADQLVQAIKITQTTLQQAYMAIKTGSMTGTAPDTLKEAFTQFKRLPGVQLELNEIHEAIKYREAYLKEMLDADARKIYTNWKTFIVMNIGIYLKQWAAVNIARSRDSLPGIAESHKRVAAAAAMVRDVVLYHMDDDTEERLNSDTLKFLKNDAYVGERRFLQQLVNRCRDVLNSAGISVFPIAFYHRIEEEEDEEDFSVEETPGFKNDVAVRVLPLLSMIIGEMDAYGETLGEDFKDKPVKKGKRKRFIAEGEDGSKKWRLNGPFNRPLFPETSYTRPFVEVGMFTLVDLRRSIQYRKYGKSQFSESHPYEYTSSLQGMEIPVTCLGVKATFKVGKNSALHTVRTDKEAQLAIRKAVGTDVVSASDFLKAVESATNAKRSHGEILENFLVGGAIGGSSSGSRKRSRDSDGDGGSSSSSSSKSGSASVNLHSYLKDAEAAGLARDIFNWKALRVRTPLKQDSRIQYDNSFSTDGEQVSVHFRSALNTAEVTHIKREKDRKSRHLKKPAKKENLFACSAQGSAQQAGINDVMEENPNDSFGKVLLKTVDPIIRQHFTRATAATAAAADVDAAVAELHKLENTVETIKEHGFSHASALIFYHYCCCYYIYRC